MQRGKNKISIAIFLFFLNFGSAVAQVQNQEVKRWEDLKSRNHSIKSSLEQGEYYIQVPVARKENTQLQLLNFPLMKTLGLIPLDAPNYISDELEKKFKAAFSIEVLAPNRKTAEPSAVATYYSDGGIGYNSGKGDGRSLWIADLIGENGKLYNISTKGTGATGLGYTNYPGHSDGLSHVADAIQEYFIGEILYQSGISDASRILGILKTSDSKTLTGGEKKQGAIMVRVSPTNLRFAHLWRYGNDPESSKRLLEYHFLRSPEFKGFTFQQAVRKLLSDNVKNSAREQATLDNFLMSQLSPTRGNRLINGQLIDFGTMGIFDLHYGDLYKQKDLGKVSTQWKYSLHWSNKLKMNLEKIVPIPNFDVEELFQKVYQETTIRLNLYRLGLDRNYIEDILAKTLDLASELSDAIEQLKKLQTSKSIQLGQKNMKAPVIDLRNFLSSIPFSRLASEDTGRFFELRDFISRFGTSYASAGFNTEHLSKLLDKLELSLKRLLFELSESYETSRSELAKTLEIRSNQRNGKSRESEIHSSYRRMNRWADLVRNGIKPTALASTLATEISDMIDFSVTSDFRASIDPGEFYLFYSEKLESIKFENKGIEQQGSPINVPKWFVHYMKSNGRDDLLFEKVKPAEILKIISAIELSVTDSYLGGPIKMALKVAKAQPSHFFEIFKQIITSFPEELNLDKKSVEEQIHDWEHLRDQISVIKSLDIIKNGKKFNLVLRGDGKHFSIKGFDQSGKLVFQDGPRKIYQQKSSGKTVLTSSLLTTWTSESLRGQSLYRDAFGIYLSEFPQIELVYLNSENIETLDFVIRVERLRNHALRKRILRIPSVFAYLVKMDVVPGNFLKGEKQALESAKNALNFLSLQGRVKLNTGWDFKKVENEFGTFVSQRLDELSVARIKRALNEFESELRNELFTSLKPVIENFFSPVYLEFLKRENSNLQISPAASLNQIQKSRAAIPGNRCATFLKYQLRGMKQMNE